MERPLDQYMLLRKGGKAIHKLGDLSRDHLDAELIYVYAEDEDNWIGQFCEGFGFFNVLFRKSDCRIATEEEVELVEGGLARELIFDKTKLALDRIDKFFEEITVEEFEDMLMRAGAIEVECIDDREENDNVDNGSERT